MAEAATICNSNFKVRTLCAAWQDTLQHSVQHITVVVGILIVQIIINC